MKYLGSKDQPRQREEPYAWSTGVAYAKALKCIEARRLGNKLIVIAAKHTAPHGYVEALQLKQRRQKNALATILPL